VTVEKKEVHETVNGEDTVKVVEVRTTTIRKLKCVEERKEWPLFGLSEEDIQANDGMSESEEVAWEYPSTEKQPQKKQVVDKRDFDEVKCRFCGGSHFSHQCPRKTIREVPEQDTTKPAEAERASQTTSTSSSGSVYSVRDRIGKSAGGAGKMGARSQEAGFRVRVNNLSEEADERDIRNLFEPFGSVIKVIYKKKYGGGNTGNASVFYRREEDALRACEKLNRKPYGLLVLSVEMDNNNRQ